VDVVLYCDQVTLRSGPARYSVYLYCPNAARRHCPRPVLYASACAQRGGGHGQLIRRYAEVPTGGICISLSVRRSGGGGGDSIKPVIRVGLTRSLHITEHVFYQAAVVVSGIVASRPNMFFRRGFKAILLSTTERNGRACRGVDV